MNRAEIPFPARLVAGAVLACAVPAACSAQAVERVPVIGGPCEGCEAVFAGMPDALTSHARIAPEDEPGEPMVLRGTVYDADGDPAPGVIVYAYHTDAGGEYPPDDDYSGHARRHGELRAWVRTDGSGRYRFDTIRPGSYPGGDSPAHVHMHVVEPGCCTYWIESVRFLDDPLIGDTADLPGRGRGGSGLVDPRREDGIWIAERDVRLRAGVSR